MSALLAHPSLPHDDLLLDRRVAIVAERLIDLRGGERVVTAVADMLPHADVFATVADGRSAAQALGNRTVRTSFVQRLPRAQRLFRAYLPLYPLAVEGLDLRRYDVVVSLSSAFAHGVLTPAHTVHVCYCHSPLRFAWNWAHDYAHGSGPLQRSLTTPLLHYVRSWDVAASHRVDTYVANSETVQQRLWKYYRRESEVVHPPVDTNRFRPSTVIGDHYLLVSALTVQKRVDIAVAAFSRLGLPLVVVGTGPEEKRLRSRAASNVTFLRRVDDERLAELYATCRAFVFTSEEDFGIAPVEAQAAGRPVIAYGVGGVCETVRNGVTGVFYDDQSAASLEAAVRDFDPDRFNPATIRAHASRFSVDNFQRAFALSLLQAMNA